MRFNTAKNILWNLIIVLLITGCGKDETNDTSAAPVANENPEETESLEEASTNGTLIFEVNDPNVDPESVEAYIVGQTSLVAERIEQESQAEGESADTASDNNQNESKPTFKIEGVPPGKQDVIITAGTLSLDTSLLSSKTLGLRLNNITIEEGKSVVKKNLTIPPMGSISGFARLLNQTNHELISIAIPGTNIPMGTTDQQGSYQMQNLPVGSHRLAFSKDGYLTGRILDLVVEPNKLSLVEDVELIADTGSIGTLTIDLTNGHIFSFFVCHPEHRRGISLISNDFS